MNRLSTSRRITGIVVFSVVALVAALLYAQGQDSTPPNDAFARLGRQLERGEATLEYREGTGYLPSLLEHLGVNIDSQVLVFSKTSFQQTLINPKNPRALYFNDHVSVGTVPGGEVYELVALEPNHGLVFYSLSTKRVERPRFERRGIECLFCHGPGNKGAPALVVASVIPNADGLPAYTSAFINTIDHRTPIAERWGGWYVTGTHGSQRHLGNAFAPDPDHPLDLQQAGTQNLTTLAGKFDVAKYLTGSSDIVALMTLGHQVGMANRINALGFQYRAAERGGVSAADWTRLEGEIDDLVGYMLFVGEARLDEPMEGVSAFTHTFAQRGPRDRWGRSLRDFDLRKRLFRYPLSYMVYSEIFDGMPAPARERVYRRLYDVLTDSEKEASGKYAALSAADRKAVFEILVDTKPTLPAYWTSPILAPARARP